MSINYKLFNPDGVPVRAVIKATFLEFMRNEWMVKKQNDQSPDVTHVRTVKEGDTLPLLAYEVYGDPKYYLSVAKANQLFDFRELVPGQELRFPPIEK
jgi:nucleoid-associated protein YgaU